MGSCKIIYPFIFFEKILQPINYFLWIISLFIFSGNNVHCTLLSCMRILLLQFWILQKNCKCNVILLCKRTLVAVMWRNIFRKHQNAMWDALIHANLSNFLFSQVNEIMFQKPYLWTRLLFHHVNLFWMQYQVCTMTMVKWT